MAASTELSGTGSPRTGLDTALLDSRQRWRAFAALGADMAWETDADGRLTFLSPDAVLGWPAASLVGHPAHALLMGHGPVGHEPNDSDPFRTTQAIRTRRTWLVGADGTGHCLAITAEPVMDAAGRFCGARGIGVDVTARERADAQAAAAFRRGEVLDHILGQLRLEVQAPRMMDAMLTALMRALGADGAAVLMLPDASGAVYAVGADPAALLADAETLLADGDSLAEGASASGARLLACPASTRFGDRAGVLAWRAAGARPWDADDRTLLASVTGVVRIMLEHEAIQRALAGQARTDPLTGLLNRGAFLEEATRRIDRLDREGLPGTLLYVDLDRLQPLNDHLGHGAGDAALVLLAAALRRTVRPADLVARLGGDEFALWLDGSDELTAAERAESLRLTYPRELGRMLAGQPAGLTLSTGIACRQPNRQEDLPELLARADRALRDVKRAGGGQWRVSHPDAVS